MKSAAYPIAFVIVWTLLVAFLANGCTVQPVQPQTVPGAIGAAEKTLIIGATTLADLADAGVVSRQSDEYRDLVRVLKEARDMVAFAWQAHFDGNDDEAGQWRTQALQLYETIRPKLLELSKRANE